MMRVVVVVMVAMRRVNGVQTEWSACMCAQTLFNILAVRAHTPKNIASALRGAVLFVETRCSCSCP